MSLNVITNQVNLKYRVNLNLHNISSCIISVEFTNNYEANLLQQSKTELGADVALWINLLPVMPACHMDPHLRPICSASDLAPC